MNYDDWLVEQEHNYRGWNEPEDNCRYCDKPIHKGPNCCGACSGADML